MKRFIEKSLRLQAGDLGRGGLLFCYLFLIMASYLVGRVARDTLFLEYYRAKDLPYADLAIWALMWVVIPAYLVVGRRFSLPALLSGSLLFLASNCALFWWLAHTTKPDWLWPAIYVWVGVFGVIAPAQVWTLANFVFTPREAKRIFALVGSGAISGAVLGGKYASVVASNWGTENMLLGMAVMVATCSLLVVMIWRQKQKLREAAEESGEGREPEQPPLLASLKLLWSSPYLRAIGFLILAASIVTSIAGWQFKSISRQFIPNKNELGAFFGDYYFYAGIAGLLVQLTVTSRLLRRFGLGPALFVVPVALALASFGALFWISLFAGIALRSCINVLQYSIDRPTVELLYLPVPSEIKNQVKSFIDTVVWRSGDGLAALLVLAFVTNLDWSAGQVGLVSVVLIVGWCTSAIIARSQYVQALKESIRQHRLEAERASAPILDRSTSDILVENLRATDPKEILYALGLFEMENQRASHPAVRGLLSHPSPEVRAKAISILGSAGDETVRPEIDKMLLDPALEVRTEALLYLTHHAHIDPLARIKEVGDFPDFSIRSAMVAFLAKPGETQNLEAARFMLAGMVSEAGEEGQRTRMEAARLIGILPDQFEAQLHILLSDKDAEVVRQAIRAVGNLRKVRFAVRVVDRLPDPHLGPEAVEALAKCGDRIVGTLSDNLVDPAMPLEVRREIPGVLARTGAPSAAKALLESLIESDTTLRFRILSALNKLRQLHPELEFDTLMIETVLAAEILGHYRSYQILGTLGDGATAEEPVARALRESMQQELERIFRMLGLLFPKYDLHSAYFGLQSQNQVVHDNSLEFLDNILKPQMRQMLVPLLDSAVSVEKRIELANQMVGAPVESREEAVAELMASSDPWLRSCGAYAIGALGLRGMGELLDDCLEHQDPLLRETARQAKLKLATADSGS